MGLEKDGRNGRLLLQYYSKFENPKNFFIPSLSATLCSGLTFVP